MPSRRSPAARVNYLLPLSAVALAALIPGEGCRRPAAKEQEAKQTSAVPQRETWYVCYLKGARVGTEQTQVFHETEDGQPVVRTEGWQRFDVLRSGQESKVEFHFTNVETPDGKLLRFETLEKIGERPVRRRGRVVGKYLEIETETAGKTGHPTSLEWRPEFRGLDALDQTLRAEPLRPGQQRSLQALIAPYFKVGRLAIQARDWENVELPDGPRQLLRVEVQVFFLDGQKDQMTVWVDQAGETWKVSLRDLFEAVRTTKERALASEKGPTIDIFSATAIPVDRPIPQAHETQKIRYRVHLSGGDPAKVFPKGPSQRVKGIDAHTAEITVYAVRPGRPDNPDAPADPPTAEDRKPNGNVQSDDPRIKKLAREAAGKETDPWRIAVALEHFVKNYIRLTDYSQVFSTAAEVAESREGDCSEHAVLLAALCRARGLPARVAVGLVYVERSQEFAYHMWTEAHIGQKWIPLDGTLGRGGIGGAHLKLGQSSLDGTTLYSSFLPIADVVGKLKIKVLEVNPR
ncbi:MAG: transglutaminase domain-containing protein [Pirellulales bacterium]|nr:transglutaminase domain-containing protein [Pirellulales bacterium]